ncbi:MAG TPA: hypothetical protein VF897_13500, partial [Roseiflexaceae bacterium]
RLTRRPTTDDRRPAATNVQTFKRSNVRTFKQTKLKTQNSDLERLREAQERARRRARGEE